MSALRWPLPLVVVFACAGCPSNTHAPTNDDHTHDGTELDASDDQVVPRHRDGGSPESMLDAEVGSGGGGTQRDAGPTPDSGGSRRDAGAGDAGGGKADAGPQADAGKTDAGTPVDAGGVKSDAGVSASGRWVSGYYGAYQRDQYPPDQIDWSGLSHVIFTRIKTNGGGRLQLDFDVDATSGPALARDIAQRAHQNGRKALLMLGGAGAGTSIRDSASDANRAQFVSALIAAVKDLGYDGLDLDWEDDVDYDRFIALARDLRASPNAPAGLILTVPGWGINGNITPTLEPKIATLVQQLDQYNLMTYYPATAAAGYGWLSWHNCPLSGLKSSTPVTIEDSLARHAALGIPRSKLGMGIAFYAICYTGSVTAPNQSTENGVTIMGGDNDFPLTRLFSSSGSFSAANRHWDATAKVPYLTLPAAESHGCRYISFDDEESIEAKGAFTRAQGYGGTIVWTLNQGWLSGSSKPANALMQALKRGFLDP